MKKLLLQLDSDRLPSAFDRIVAYDAAADEVMAYGGVRPDDVEGLIHGAIFTRGPADLKNTAVFIGGADMEAGQELLDAAREAFFGPFKVSLMLDSNGSNTTAVAAVIKLQRAAEGVDGKRVLILAGTGPVGTRAAGLLGQEGAEVTITSRDQETAEEARSMIEDRFDCSITAEVVDYPLGAGSLVQESEIVLAAGPPGITLVTRDAWTGGKGPSVLGDVNAVPPLGIEGIEVNDDAEDRDGATVFGALGIGKFKMKLHKACVARLFESNELILDAETIYEVAGSL